MIPESRFSDKRAIWLVLAAAAALMVLFVVFERFLFLPKILMVGLILLAAVHMGKIKPLVRDWFVFMAFIYLFDSLRGIIYILTCRLQLPAYALYVLNIEKTLFHGDDLRRSLPSLALFPPAPLHVPHGSAVAKLGLELLRKGESLDLATFKPLYVRPSEAEMKWLQSHLD
jgi:hypothetical protein